MFKSAANWERLSQEDFNEAFLFFWENMCLGFQKLEVRQWFSEPEDPSFQAYARNDLALARQELRSRISDQRDLYDQISQKNLPLIRMRFVEMPLHPYLEYEFISYPISASFGERILVLQKSNVDNDILQDPYFRDMNFFPGVGLLLHIYDDSGVQQGGYLVTSAVELSLVEKLFSKLFPVTITLGSFLATQHVSQD